LVPIFCVTGVKLQAAAAKMLFHSGLRAKQKRRHQDMNLYSERRNSSRDAGEIQQQQQQQQQSASTDAWRLSKQ